MKQNVTLKRLSSILLILLMVFTLIPPMTAKAEGTTEIAIDETNFPDATFRSYLTANYDSDENGKLSQAEITKIDELSFFYENISSLNGIEHLTALKYLACINLKITSLDISKNSCLENLILGDCPLENLDVSHNTALISLDLISLNISIPLTSIDLSKNIALERLSCIQTNLTSLDVSKNPALTELDCSNNKLTSLDVSKNPALTELDCSNNKLTSLDVSKNPALETLNFNNNNIHFIDLSNNPNLTSDKDYYTYNNIGLATDNTFDLNNLPEFDAKKASEWKDSMWNSKEIINVVGSTLIIPKKVKSIECIYDCGNPNITLHACFTITHIHNPKTIKATEATCSEHGNKEYYQCTVCNKYYEDKECKKEIIDDLDKWESTPKKEHTYNEKAIYKATPAQNGVIVKKCTECGYETSEIISYPETITLSADTYNYNGKTKKPTVSVIDSNGKAIDTKYFDIIYQKGCKNVGSYNVTVAFKGDYYTGETVKTFTINPKNTSLNKPSAGKKSITVKWKKLTKKMKKSRITGYEIQYSTSSKYTSAKIKKVKGYKKSSLKLTKLKAKKKYYVRIRTYMTVNKHTYYSPWSKSKTVKTK